MREYIGKIYLEVKKRLIYIIKKYIKNKMCKIVIAIIFAISMVFQVNAQSKKEYRNYLYGIDLLKDKKYEQADIVFKRLLQKYQNNTSFRLYLLYYISIANYERGKS